MQGKSIIDIHCHTAGIGAGDSGCFVSEAMRRSWKFDIYLKAFGVSEKELLRGGDRLILQRLAKSLSQSRRVRTAVILALDGVVGDDGELDRARTEVYIPNDFIAASVRDHDNLIFGASVNPNRHDAMQRLEKSAADGAALLKWLPCIQRIDPADTRLTPFYLRLRELGLPLLTHTGSEDSFTCKRDELGDPERLRLPLALGVKVIAAHAASNGSNGGEPNFDRFLRLCAEFPNLYADISALTQLNRLSQLPRLLSHAELHSRLLYGTDMPLLNTPLVTAFAFLSKISPLQALAIARIANPWDRDVALKEALGAPEELFSKAGEIIKSSRLPATR